MSLWLLLQSLVMTAGQLARGHHFNMNGSNSYATEDATQRRDALVSRLFDATLGAWDILAVYIDDRLDFYRTLAERGPVTSPELATATGPRTLCQGVARATGEQPESSTSKTSVRWQMPAFTACRKATRKCSSTIRALTTWRR